jgi:four helix bundle protein
MSPTTGAKADALKKRTKQFALGIVGLYRSLPHCEESRIIGRQLLRCATSVAANYRAVCRARSKADFLSKLGIVLEESDESLFWLEMLVDAGIVSHSQVRILMEEANQLVANFVASLRTAKGCEKSAI